MTRFVAQQTPLCGRSACKGRQDQHGAGLIQKDSLTAKNQEANVRQLLKKPSVKRTKITCSCKTSFTVLTGVFLSGKETWQAFSLLHWSFTLSLFNIIASTTVKKRGRQSIVIRRQCHSLLFACVIQSLCFLSELQPLRQLWCNRFFTEKNQEREREIDRKGAEKRKEDLRKTFICDFRVYCRLHREITSKRNSLHFIHLPVSLIDCSP